MGTKFDTADYNTEKKANGTHSQTTNIQDFIIKKHQT